MKIFEEKGYTYKEHLNTGGEGEIHLIKSVDKLFVAKIFPLLDDSTFLLLNNLSNLNIPNIPEIHDVFNHEGRTIIIRDFVEGQTLYDYMKEIGPLGYIETKSIILKICATLKALHNLEPNPIIYRDLKPENIIITPHKEIRLIDFGIARYYKQENTRDTVLAGTRGYTAPEVLAGMQSDNRSDIYSVGLLFYEMLTGKNLLEPPYQIRPVKESNANLEKWLDEIIAKATDFNQTNRYSTIEEFIYYLEHPHKIYSKKRRKIFLIALSCLFFIAAGLYAVSLIFFANYDNITGSEEPFEITDTIPENNQPETPDVQVNNQPLGYTELLNLNFDIEEHCDYVLEYPELNSQFSFFDGKLDVENEVCRLDFYMKNNMMVHYRVMASDMSTVGLGPYSVSGMGTFSCAYYDPQIRRDFFMWDAEMLGRKISMNDYFVDVLIYTNKDNSAVYAFIIDEEKEKVSYTAFRVPPNIIDDLSLDMTNFNTSGDDFLHIESVKIIEGSMHEYIAQNFISYHKNKKEIDGFFKIPPSDLADIPFE